MIITKTPYRISLFGGGTDHPSWYKKHGGEVISFAIDKYCYISTRILPPFFDHKYRIAYSKVETVNDFKKILHPVVREAIRKFSPNLSLEIHHDGDLPARSGLGSSSSFTVGMLNALNALQGKHISKNDLAKQAIFIEQKVLNENVGCQDQIAAAYGGFNKIEFFSENSFKVSRVILKRCKALKFSQSLPINRSFLSLCSVTTNKYSPWFVTWCSLMVDRFPSKGNKYSPCLISVKVESNRV